MPSKEALAMRAEEISDHPQTRGQAEAGTVSSVPEAEPHAARTELKKLSPRETASSFLAYACIK